VVFLPVIHMSWINETSRRTEAVDRRTPPDVVSELPAGDQAASLRQTRLVGYAMLLVTASAWGVNWPVGKYLLHDLPPLAMRGVPGSVGALLLAAVAIAQGVPLRVPRDRWPRLVLFSALNVTCWMALVGLALVYLPASETAVIGATMPVWAAALAWPILGERLTARRLIAMAMAIAGLAVLMGGDGIAANQAKLPGIIYALLAAFGFALGAVLTKRRPLQLPPLNAAVWQLVIGCVPLALFSVLFEQPHFTQLSGFGWSLFAYAAVVQMCIGYFCWFGALERLPASVAAIGTLLVPVIGVVASALSLGEPLGVSQIGALALTMAGVVIASRS
jgi:drug/metabolite transporter (DMT)-like permease